MRLSISLLLVGFFAIAFAFPIAHDQSESNQDELDGERMGLLSPEELAVASSVPNTSDIPEQRAESEPWDKKRLRRDGLPPPVLYVTPAAELDEQEANATEEQDSEKGEDVVRAKRNGLNQSYVSPASGVGSAEAEESEESENEDGKRVKRQILEIADDTKGRGLFTPPPFLPNENDLVLVQKALIEHEIGRKLDRNETEPEVGMQERRRIRCSICTEEKQRVGDEGATESGRHEESTKGPFDSHTGERISNEQEELPERVRRSASIEKREVQHPDHWSEDQEEMIEKILKYQVV